jgi:hypothetical protein
MDSAFPDEERVPYPGPAPNRPPHRVQRGIPFNLGKLQIAGIILVFVFIWCVVSAVVISMFEIHMLALTEFEDDGKGDVSGFITDENGISLENVTVAIHGTQHFTRTNLEGYYSIKDVKEGDYEIEASLNGYGAVIKRVSIDAHIPALVDFVLEEGGFDKTANERYGSNLSDLRHLNYATAIVILIYGSLALIGGILAFFQRFYWIAMFGALCGTVSGVLSIGIIIASILSIIALILIVGNQEDFIASETSFIDRIFGTRRAETRARGGPKARAQKLKAYGAPAKPESKAIPSYAEEEYVPSKPLPMGEMEPAPQRISEEIEKPSPTCVACGGLVKADSQGVQCQCGAYYHRFCAGSISKCKNCGAPL